MRWIAVSLVGLAAGCGRMPAPAPMRAAPNRPIYDGTVTIDPVTRRLKAEWQIDVMRDGSMRDSATLLLNPELVLTALTGAEVAGYSEKIADGDKRITVRFTGAPANQGTATRIHVAYFGKPSFGTDSINGMSSSWVELGLDSYWFPTFNDYAQLITGRTRIVLPSEWKLAASGAVRRAGDTLTLTNSVPLIDIALSASPELSFIERNSARVYYTGRQPAVVPTVLDITNACTLWLDARYGARDPLPPIRMVFAPRGGPGYARKNYIVITSAADTSTVQLQRFICHELAHYWSSGAIASGPENWLNESFAEYIAGRYVRDASGQETYATMVLKKWQDNSSNAGPVWTPTSTRRPTARAAYNKAPALLDQLEQRIGRATMDTLLTRYMTEQIHTTQALLDMIASVAGAETSAWFKGELRR